MSCAKKVHRSFAGCSDPLTSMPCLTPDQLLQELTGEDLLIVQDLDGVCMPLVKDPLTRRMDAAYVEAVAALDGQFAVLTNGEHEGRRGVNRPWSRPWGFRSPQT